jgi:hypothetical protein
MDMPDEHFVVTAASDVRKGSTIRGQRPGTGAIDSVKLSNASERADSWSGC